MTIKQILLPVADVVSSAAFYTAQFGFKVKVMDAPRYAALDGGGITLALVSNEENVANGRASFAIAVEDVDRALESAVAAGASVVTPPQNGPHERRAVIGDPEGHPVVLYAKL